MFIRRWLIGIPLATVQASRERLSKVVALAVFSSDALSSVAYATEEMLLVLVLAGSLALGWSLPLSLASTFLLGILTVSYRQTIHAYPSGGGSYIVAKANLGELPGLTAAAALMIDYILTVSVSVAAGVAALTSAVPALHRHRVGLALLAIGIVTVVNLRGIRESGRTLNRGDGGSRVRSCEEPAPARGGGWGVGPVSRHCLRGGGRWLGGHRGDSGPI